jgi:tetratricopeptide (TPR) repeat protein
VILPLQLRHDATADAAPEAWFLPGDSAERWLSELARCGLAEAQTRLFLIPRSISDRAAAGLLVVPARNILPDHHPAGLPCRSVAGRLYVPADAVLFPPVTDAEVRSLCPLPISFCHPVFGLSGFEEEAALRVGDLTALPEERADNWNFAHPGAPALPELIGVMLAMPPSIEDIFGGAEEDIASEPPIDLPPAPDEPKEDALAKTKRNLRKLFAEGVAKAMKQVPHTGSRRTWVNDAEDWAQKQLQGVSQQLDQIRDKELHRLLHLLATDPEAGLRHAIPMNSFAHRGVAPPGGRLGTRSLNFDPSKLGGGPADYWDVPPDMQEILRRRYREMADREMRLGRHRRAAYIFAELLGDLLSAANALKQGRHFREAALLYDEQLKNPVEAARCLAEGGLLAEAIERYTKLERWLDVADLHERLGNRADAEVAIRRVVNERRAQDDILTAAKLMEERLHAPYEALEMLLGAWPISKQSVACVGEAFQLLAKLGRHEVALERMIRFGREPLPKALLLPLLTTFGRVAHDYPHHAVRHRAADFSRVLVAGQLKAPGLSDLDASQLMQCLVRLAPEDRLVGRDANRHLAQRRAANLRVHRVTPPPLTGNKPVVERRFELPRQIEWLKLRSEWHWFYAIGVTDTHLTLVRGIWEGEIQSVTWKCSAIAVKNSALVFEPTGEKGCAVALAMPGGVRLEQKRFPASDQFYGQDCLAGMPGWLPAQEFPFAFGDESVWSGHVAAGRAILGCYDKRGKLQRTIDVTQDLLAGATRLPPSPLCVAAIGNGAAIALGNRLVLTRSDGGLTRIELPEQAMGLLATEPHTRHGVAVMLRHGAVMHWLGTPGLLELARDLAAPIGAFVPGGPLVLISEASMHLLHVDSRGVQKVTRVEVPGQRPIGVCATSGAGRFAVLGALGEMTVYRVPL